MLCRADLANLVNEAALLAGRQRKVVVDKIDFIQAVERSIAVSLLVYLCVCWREGGERLFFLWCAYFSVLFILFFLLFFLKLNSDIAVC
jgi:hypothetical protein